jgi:hypothetical protein
MAKCSFLWTSQCFKRSNSQITVPFFVGGEWCDWGITHALHLGLNVSFEVSYSGWFSFVSPSNSGTVTLNRVGTLPPQYSVILPTDNIYNPCCWEVQLNKLLKKKKMFICASHISWFHFMFCVNLCQIWFIQNPNLQNTKVYNITVTVFVLFIYFKYEWHVLDN